MKLKLFTIFGSLALFLALLFSFFPLKALAVGDTSDTYGNLDKVKNSSGAAGKSVLEKMSNVEGSATSLVGTILSYVGIAFLLLMIYGGILWMVSSGNDDQIKKARKIIINAVIGLIIVILAYAATSYIGGRLSGS